MLTSTVYTDTENILILKVKGFTQSETVLLSLNMKNFKPLY